MTSIIHTYNWQEIQAYYNDNHSLRECIDKFGFTWKTIGKAKRAQLFVTRTISASSKLRKFRDTIPKHTQATKDKISKIRKEHLALHPEQVPYKLNHYSKRTSYPEKYFIEVIEKEQIALKHHLQIGLYEVDFYNENLKIYLEIDGDQHYLDKRIIESDLRRNSFLAKQGWIGMRLRWSNYQKLNYEQKNAIIMNIRKFIVDNNRSASITQII